jgi:hypothetical protein
MHHLRFDSEAAKRQVAAAPALRVEGIIRHPPLEQPLEYFVIIAIRNDRGEEVTRQVVNVGALQAAEKRTFTLSVEVLPPQAPVPTKSNASTGTFKSPIPQPTATVRPSTPPPTSTPASTAGSAATPPAGQTTGATTAASSTPAASPTAGTPGGAKPPASSPPQTPSARGIQPPRVPPQAPPKPGANPNTPASNSPNAPQPSGTNPASPAKPTSGYVLKPPSPGGPKRH